MTAITPQSIIDGKRGNNWKDLSGLISEVEGVFKYEKKIGKGRLRNTIQQIKLKKAFCYFPVAYLPSRGEVIIIGDIHGDALSLRAILKQECVAEKLKDKDTYLIFLGDYTDRGREDVKTLQIILGLKRYFPKNVFLLRGNHEEFMMGQHYGLLGSCISKFGYERGQFIFQQVNELFERMPGIAVCGNGLVAVHGGIPVSKIRSLKDLRDEENLTEMRWNDPAEEVDTFMYNYKRGDHYLFGQRVFDAFLKAIGGSVLVRSHEYVARGSKLLFDNRLLVIFSNGGSSYQSGYRDFILKPKYAKVSLDKPITAWQDSHIKEVKM